MSNTTNNVLGRAARATSFDSNFEKVWNSCTDFSTAIEKLTTTYGVPSAAVRAHAKMLVDAGTCRPLPVTQGGQELSEAEVFTFCLLWTRSPTMRKAVKALQLPKETVLGRWKLLRQMGVRLGRKPDMPGTEDGPPDLRPAAWKGSVESLNKALDGELLVRRALARQKPIREKLAAAQAMLGKVTVTLDGVAGPVDEHLLAVVALLLDVFREMEIQ